MIYQILTWPLFLATRSLTQPEGFAYFLSRLPIPILIKQGLAQGISPLYYSLLHIWASNVGTNEIILRSFSLVWFAIFILFIHHILMEIMHIQERQAYLTLFFFVFNPILLYFAFQVNAAMMFLALSTVSFYFLVKKKYGLYVVVSILAGLTHWSFLLLLIAHGLYAVSVSKKTLAGYLLHIWPILVVLLPIVGIMFFQSPSFALQQVITTFGVLCFGTLLSVIAVYVSMMNTSITKGLIIGSVLVPFVAFYFLFLKVSSLNLRTTARNIKAVAKKNDVVYIKDPELYYLATYYFGTRVYLFSPSSHTTQARMIPKNNIISTLPTYPHKAFMIDNTGYFEAVASF